MGQITEEHKYKFKYTHKINNSSPLIILHAHIWKIILQPHIVSPTREKSINSQ